MTSVIVFASSKGGVGKTTVVANIGVAMAQLGHNVVLLDADLMMANLGFMLGLEEQKVTLHDVMAEEAKLSEASAGATSFSDNPDPKVRRSVALGEPVVTHSPKSRSAREFKLAVTLAKVSDAG
jgi:MinD-like ATPase involved in chromosome partitioning or flagellar assembly